MQAAVMILTHRVMPTLKLQLNARRVDESDSRFTVRPRRALFVADIDASRRSVNTLSSSCCICYLTFAHTHKHVPDHDKQTTMSSTRIERHGMSLKACHVRNS